MDKTDKLLEDNEDVAAHHGLYSKNPARAPRGTSNNPILMPLSYMGDKQHTGDAESKGEPCFLEVCSGRAHWNPWVCCGHQWQMDSAHAGRYARVCALWSAVRSHGVAQGNSAASGISQGIVSSPTFFYPQRALWNGLEATFSPLRKVLPLLIPMGCFNID